jgi:hypothetical protein
VQITGHYLAKGFGGNFMKKIFLFIIALLLIAPFVKFQTNADTSITVTVASYFDELNLIDHAALTNQTLGSTIQLDTVVGSEAFSTYEFVYWVVNGKVREYGIDHQFVVSSSLDIIAVFSANDKYAVLFMDSNRDLLNFGTVSVPDYQIQWVARTGVTASAPVGTLPTKPNLTVSATPWLTDDAKEITDNIDGHTIFVLQYTNDVTSDRSLTIGVGSPSNHTYNTIVTASTSPVLGDDVFSYWKDTDTNAKLSYDLNYKFTILENRNLTPVYEGVAETPVPIVSISNKLSIRNNMSTYVGQFSVPSGYTLVEYGFLILDNYVPNLTHATVGVVVAQSNYYQPVTKEFVTSFNNSIHVSVRAYLIVKNNSTQELEDIIYSDITSTNQGLMIYAAYGGGGNSGAFYKQDYVVLWNGTNKHINLSGYSIQYASAAGTTWGSTQQTNLTGTINSKGYYLIRLAGGSGGTDITSTYYSQIGSNTNMQASNFKLALMSTTTTITSGISSPIGDGTFGQYVVDFLGAGTANAFEGAAAAPAPSNTTMIYRNKHKDTNQNSVDYATSSAGEGHLDYLLP